MFSRRFSSGLTPLIVLALCMLAACGGGDDPSPIPQPGGPQPPPTSTINPCSQIQLQSGAPADASIDQAALDPTQRALAEAAAADKRSGLSGDDRDVRDSLWEHYLRGGSVSTIAGARPAASQDIGEIAVLEDDTTLMLRQNAFDLRNLTLRFERTSGGYDVTRAEATYYPLGSQLTLTDDATSRQTIPFSFPYFGTGRTSVFVNSDGNLTFDEGDTASTARSFGRLLNGPARIAPFFADLDPSVSGGGVFVHAASDVFVVTYCSVRAFESTRSVTVQAALLPSGILQFTFGDQIDLTEGIVAIAPGRNETFTPLDLSATNRTTGGAGAAGERFAEEGEIDVVAVAKRFYATHGDLFDQLVVWADAPVVGSDVFAYESTVSNEIRGIGQDVFDASRDFGSAGRLRSLVVMDRLGKYPEDPVAIVLGENSSLAVLAHETGHRWLALLRFRDTNGQASDLLLGRQRAHWSYFLDSDASVMEGNDIEAQGGGAFRTIGAAQRYSRLDLYAMGLATAAEVPAFFFVDAPINVQPPRDRESAPRSGVTFNGTRRDVLIQDVIDALGARQPSAAESPRNHRQAFIYVIGAGTSPGAAEIQKLDRIRREWPAFFQRATEGRMTVETTLR